MNENKKVNKYNSHIRERRDAVRSNWAGHNGHERTSGKVRRVLVPGSMAVASVLVGGKLVAESGNVSNGVPTGTTIVTAKEGDNLWQLQADNEGFGDDNPIDVRDKLVERNGLVIHPDQEIILVDYPKTTDAEG
jgi:hypothetical protein